MFQITFIFVFLCLKCNNFILMRFLHFFNVEDTKDESNEMVVESLIVELGSQIYMRWPNSDVWMRMIPTNYTKVGFLKLLRKLSLKLLLKILLNLLWNILWKLLRKLILTVLLKLLLNLSLKPLLRLHLKLLFLIG